MSTMEPHEIPRSTWQARMPEAEMSTRELVAAAVASATDLVRDEIELARLELKRDLKAQMRSSIWLVVGVVFALMVLALLLVAVAFALATVLPGWGAALIVAGFAAIVATITGIVGYVTIVRKPLDVTRRTLKENLEWAKKRRLS